MFRLRDTSPYRRDIFYLAGLCPFYLIYALLNNNWVYTYYPLGSIALVLTGFVLWEFLYLRKMAMLHHLPAWKCALGACLCLGVFAFKTYISLSYFRLVFAEQCSHNVMCLHDYPFTEEVKGADGPLSFGALTIDFGRWTRLNYYTGAPWVTRFGQLWMLPQFLISDDAFKQRHPMDTGLCRRCVCRGSRCQKARRHVRRRHGYVLRGGENMSIWWLFSAPIRASGRRGAITASYTM